jgi:predicted AAA+ superfamily ATPase
MEQAFLFFSVGRFSYKLKEQVKAPRKAYCIDNGLISTQAFRFSEDRGRLYENVVALTLFKKALEGDVQVYYWQGQQREEVDFVVKEGTRVASLIQVCSDPSSEKVLAREARSLLKAGEALGCKNLLLLTDSHEGEMSFSWYGLKGRVRMEPLWRWVLQGNQQP